MGGILFNNNAINQKGTPLLFSDIFANRPQAAIKGRLFFSTDTSAIYEDTGSTWTLLANVGINSVGTLEQVTTNGNSTDQGITITANGLTSNKVVVIGGTSSQFLKADGTLDNNTYLTTSSAASTYQPLITLTTTGTSGAATFTANTLNIPNYGTALSGYLPLSGGTLTGALSGTSATFNAGNVGIGTTSPGALLNVVGQTAGLSGTAYYNAAFEQDKTNYRGVILGYDISGQIGVIAPQSAGPANALAFWTYSGSAWGEKMRITSGGNVLIDTPDAGYKLQVNGSALVTQIITSQTWLNASTFNQTFTISPANGAGTTIISNNSTNYTWTMEPAISNNRMYILRTIGSNTITINTSGSDVIINNAGSSVSSLTMTLSTGAIILQSDGSSRWLQIK